MRLNKFLSNSGVASRRKCDQIILDGKVTVNGKVVNELGVNINEKRDKIEVEGKEIKLTPTEYNILKFLTKNKGIVYSIEQIYENVWEEESYGAENIIAVHIRHIREKIEINPREPKYLKVIWGVGYKIENLDEKEKSAKWKKVKLV